MRRKWKDIPIELKIGCYAFYTMVVNMIFIITALVLDASKTYHTPEGFILSALAVCIITVCILVYGFYNDWGYL